MKPFQVITYLIASLFVIMFMVFFTRTSDQAQRNLLDSVICTESVREAAIVRFESLSLHDEIKCPTLFIELSDSQSKSKSAVFETAALAMADTWKEFQKGELEIFKTDTQNYCVIRRVIEFKGDSVQHKGFYDYLVTHNPPQAKYTYFNYLTNVDLTSDKAKRLSDEDFKKADSIDTSKPVAVVFVMNKKGALGPWTSTGIGAAIGVTAGTALLFTGIGTPIGLTLVAGSVGGAGVGYMLGSDSQTTWQSSTLLIPYTEESLKSLDCTKLPSTLARLPK